MNEKEIWDAISEEVKNPYGVAGIMGNLMAESSLNPICITKKGLSITGAEYVRRIKDGTITPDEFAHDGVAFGLVQWLFWSRKNSLLDYVEADHIDNVGSQIHFMLYEMKKYRTVWETVNNAKTVKKASDSVMLGYERPGNVSEKAKEKRAKYGEEFYAKYAAPKGKMVETTADRVLLRCGNGKNFDAMRRIEVKGTQLKYVAKSDNNWIAVVSGNEVLWVSGSFARIVGG